MARRLSLAAVLATGALLSGAAPAAAQEKATLLEDIKTIYLTWHYVEKLVDQCWEAAAFAPVYKEAGENWNVRNFPAKDAASKALVVIRESPQAMEIAVAAVPANPGAAPAAQPDPVGYCQGVVAALDSGAFDLEQQFGQQLTVLRAVAGVKQP